MEALREDDGWYAAIFESLAVGLIVFEAEPPPDRRIVDANAAAARLLGYARDELVGLTAPDITVKEDLEREQSLLEALAAGDRESAKIEKRYIRKDGTLLWGRATLSLLRDADGEARYLLKLVEDVTPERDAEAERRELEEQLRQAQKMEALGRLSGGVAHDFNNLLQVIAGNAQLALASEGPAAAEHLREIVGAAGRASALTQQLLAFSRTQPLETTPVDLNETVCRLERMLGRLVGVDIRVSTDLTEEPAVIDCDATGVEQIVLNLVLNARDAMPEGGTVTIQTRRVERNGRPCIALVVADTGEGMDAATAQRAFDPFFTTKEIGKGTGLGLSMVDGIVGQCGGTVSVRSRPGGGTRFELAFPASVSEPKPRPRPPAAARGSETVLLVDDDPAVRELTAEYLSTQGYRVLPAAGAAEAEEIFGREDVDALVTDAVMPDVNGRELYRRLAAAKPDLPVVYMSGYDPATADVPTDAASRFLQKPYSLPKLAEALRSLLG